MKNGSFWFCIVVLLVNRNRVISELYSCIMNGGGLLIYMLLEFGDFLKFDDFGH